MIRETITTMKGIFNVEHNDADSFDNLPYHFHRAAGLCIFEEQFVMCRTKDDRIHFPGGSVEPNETLEQALIREVHEESNMEVIRSAPIGYQKMWNDAQAPLYQAYFYAEVQPYGPFKSDPGGGHIVEVFYQSAKELLDQQIYGTRGQRLVERAIELHHQNLKT